MDGITIAKAVILAVLTVFLWIRWAYRTRTYILTFVGRRKDGSNKDIVNAQRKIVTNHPLSARDIARTIEDINEPDFGFILTNVFHVAND